jgi:hypothetical protein
MAEMPNLPFMFAHILTDRRAAFSCASLHEPASKPICLLVASVILAHQDEILIRSIRSLFEYCSTNLSSNGNSELQSVLNSSLWPVDCKSSQTSPS